jgi:hypothetical protein
MQNFRAVYVTPALLQTGGARWYGFHTTGGDNKDERLNTVSDCSLFLQGFKKTASYCVPCLYQ